MFLSAAALALSPATAGSTATSALILSGRACATLKPNAAALAVKQHDAGTDFVDQRGIGGDDRVVGVEPARHDLLHEIVVGLDRKLGARQRLALRGIGIP